jgi:release factor glutamine methyltransferase
MTNTRTPSIAAALEWAKSQFEDASQASIDAQTLLALVLRKDRAYLFTWPERGLTLDQWQHFQALAARRVAGEPTAYIVGEKEFWSLPFYTEPSTLIPRPETELLVELALSLPLPDRAHVLDLGTGTGAIALALASEQPTWQITGVDRSQAAVALASRNQNRLDLSQVQFLQSDWFSALEPQKFALIVSNPPYIDAQDPWLQQGDVRFEPDSALVAPESGLGDVRQIVAQSTAFLADRGWLLLEHGYDQGEAVRALLSGSGLVQVRTVQDLQGHDRITLGQLVQKL